MASPGSDEQTQAAQVGQKRKREDEETDGKNEVEGETKDNNHVIEHESKNGNDDDGGEDDGGAKVDTNTLVPDHYEPEKEDDEEQDGSDDENENAVEESANYPKHEESDEPFPHCAYYDEAIEDIEERFTLIPQRIFELLADRRSSSTALVAYKDKADELGEIPCTEKMRIAILGGAGAGKSSLLNAVTGKPDLAKSVSLRSTIIM
jgi:chromosomal replication initiation ATPase DnaA